MKENKSKLSRRTFLSGMAIAGASSTLGASWLKDTTEFFDISNEVNDITITESKPDARLLKRLIPKPKFIRIDDDKEVLLDKTLRLNIEVAVSKPDMCQKISKIFTQYFGTDPIISVIERSGMPTGEAYKIYASGSVLTLSATDLTGICYALSTLRQLAEANSDSAKLVSYRIPEIEIEDAPANFFRGLHLCWFPETEAIQIEQYLRWAAYYKFNHVIIEFWGTFPFKSHPALGWVEYSASREDIDRLVEIAKELGITLIPQINIFGHASASRWGAGKHVMLDLYPEYQPLFEPDGWVWCLSNPATRKVLSDAILETLEAFDYPPYYHIGGDEASGAAECRSCRHSDYKTLLIDHLTYFYELLGEKKCRMMMWHDMLIRRDDQRWKGYVANGSSQMSGVLDALPRDIIICDWQYGAPKEDETWPTMSYFKDEGFTVFACPWNKINNILSVGENVSNAGLDGLLCTTWHSPSYNQMLQIMLNGAQAAWATPPYVSSNGVMGMRHLRQVGWDIPVKNYQNTGIHEWQVRPDIHP